MADEDTPLLEQQVIGLAMTGPRCLADTRPIRAAWFSDVRCAEVWQVIQRLDSDGTPVDVQTVIGNRGDMSEAVRRQVTDMWLFDCYAAAPPDRNAEAYTEQMRERYGRRVVWDALMRGRQLIEGNASIRETRLEVMSALEAADVGSVNLVESADAARGAVEAMFQPSRYMSTPWTGINNVIRGWRPGGLYIIGARPSVGKSLVVQKTALELAKRGNVILETFEMSATEVATRLISSLTGIHLSRLSGARADGTTTLSDRDKTLIYEARDYLGSLPLRYGDRAATTLDVREHARDTSMRGPIAGIIVDYLGLMTSVGRVESRVQEVSRFTRELKRLAMEFDCPVIVACQLNRESARDGTRPPSLTDLRESGSIEQDADVVILLSEDKPSADTKKEDVGINADIAKNRQGPRRTIPLVRLGGTATIQDDPSRSIE